MRLNIVIYHQTRILDIGLALIQCVYYFKMKVSILLSLLLLFDCSKLTAAQSYPKVDDVKNAVEVVSQFVSVKSTGNL